MARSNIISLSLATALFGGCDPADTYYVTEEGDRYVHIDVTVTPNEDDTDTGTEPTDPQDPCDVEFRAYTEDGSYVDLTLGGMPELRVVSHTASMTEGRFPQVHFELSSYRHCGEVEILGVQAVIHSLHGLVHETDSAFSALINLDTVTTHNTEFGWTGNAASPWKTGAYATWDSVWTHNFTAFTLGADDTNRFWIDLDGMADFPPGEYDIEYMVRWRDIETGTVSYANIEKTVEHLVVNDDACLVDLPTASENDGWAKVFAPPSVILSAFTPSGSVIPGWHEVLRFNVEASSCGNVGWIDFGSDLWVTDNAAASSDAFTYGWYANGVPYRVIDYSTREVLEEGLLFPGESLETNSIGLGDLNLDGGSFTTISIELDTTGASAAEDDAVQLSLYGASWVGEHGAYNRVSIPGTPTVGGVLIY